MTRTKPITREYLESRWVSDSDQPSTVSCCGWPLCNFFSELNRERRTVQTFNILNRWHSYWNESRKKYGNVTRLFITHYLHTSHCLYETYMIRAFLLIDFLDYLEDLGEL